jgi:hypothetical protein
MKAPFNVDDVDPNTPLVELLRMDKLSPTPCDDICPHPVSAVNVVTTTRGLVLVCMRCAAAGFTQYNPTGALQ